MSDSRATGSRLRWAWPVAVFVAALIGGAAGGTILARDVFGLWMRNDSVLLGILTSTFYKGDLESRLRTIEAAERNDSDAVIRLNCAYLVAASAQLRSLAKGSQTPEAYDGVLERTDTEVARLKAADRCGSPRTDRRQ